MMEDHKKFAQNVKMVCL